MACDYGFPQQLPTDLLAEYQAQQKACMVPKPLRGLDSIGGLENDKGDEWLLQVQVTRNITCYYLAVKKFSFETWSITEIDDTDPRVRARLPREPSSRRKKRSESGRARPEERLAQETRQSLETITQTEKELKPPGVPLSQAEDDSKPLNTVSAPCSTSDFVPLERAPEMPQAPALSMSYAEFVERFNRKEILPQIDKSLASGFLTQHPFTQRHRAAIGCFSSLVWIGSLVALVLLFVFWPLSLILLFFCWFPLRTGIIASNQQTALSAALENPGFYHDAVAAGVLSVVKK